MVSMGLKEIVSGWMNVIVKTDEVEQASIKRMKICDSCPSKTKQLGIDVCDECSCPLIAKTRSMESRCPLNKWEAIKENI